MDEAEQHLASFSRSRRFWALWIGVNTAILCAILVLNIRDIFAFGVFFSITYAGVLVPIQTVLLRPMVPGSRRPWIVALLPFAVPFLWFALALGGYLILAVTYGAFFSLVPGSEYALPFLTPGVGGVVAGLLQAWVLSTHRRGTSRLIAVHAICATVVGSTAGLFLDGFPPYAPRPHQSFDAWRMVPGLAAGPLLSVAVAYMLSRLQARTDVEIGHVASPAPAPRERAPRPDRTTVLLWLNGHVLLMLALNMFIPTVPQSPVFGLLGYGLTVGLLQSAVIYWWLSDVAPFHGVGVRRIACLPPLAGLVSIPLGLVVLFTLASFRFFPSPIGHTPAGFPVFTPYLLLAAFPGIGLMLGWLQWRPIRTFSRGRAWSGLFLSVQALAPLIMTGVAFGVLYALDGQRALRRALEMDRSIASLTAAALAGLAVALLVGAALWLMLLPERPADDTALPLAA